MLCYAMLRYTISCQATSCHVMYIVYNWNYNCYPTFYNAYIASETIRPDNTQPRSIEWFSRAYGNEAKKSQEDQDTVSNQIIAERWAGISETSILCCGTSYRQDILPGKVKNLRRVGRQRDAWLQKNEIAQSARQLQLKLNAISDR